uniref:Uncharacterized protein n=1 Tax=Sphaerodactylus townsendi TaxID=933632 RepID=A0ACB8E6N8_9SAUR
MELAGRTDLAGSVPFSKLPCSYLLCLALPGTQEQVRTCGKGQQLSPQRPKASSCSPSVKGTVPFSELTSPEKIIHFHRELRNSRCSNNQKEVA